MSLNYYICLHSALIDQSSEKKRVSYNLFTNKKQHHSQTSLYVRASVAVTNVNQVQN